MSVNHYVFIKRYNNNDFIILQLYVDDMLIMSHDKKRVANLKP